MLIDLAAPPVQPVWWFAWVRGYPEKELHVRIKTRLWVDAIALASEALGVMPELVCLIHEGETLDATDERLK